jgi:citrate lyase subunit beta / citryl-CoA lyase
MRKASSMDTIRLIRSKLFVPGSRPELFPKAFASAADALSFDLEDAVVASRKAEARAQVVEFLRTSQGIAKVTIVRVNGLHSDHFAADVAALAGSAVDIINLPKAESREDVLRAADAIRAAERSSGSSREIGILANIETPKGLRLAYEIATADPRVIGLQLGFNDFSMACGISSKNTVALNQVRLGMRFAAAEAGLVCFDGAFADVKDLEAFRAESEQAKALGFMGKSCIHPSQIAIANAVFAPSLEEIERARQLLAAAEDAIARGLGAFMHEGEMVDAPIIARARAVVSLGARLPSVT